MAIQSWQLFNTGKNKPVDGLPWASGGDTHAFLAKRNITGKANLSAMLAKAIYMAANGNIEEITMAGDGQRVCIKARSATSPEVRDSSWEQLGADGSANLGIPKYEDHLNYHFGLLFIALALAKPRDGRSLNPFLRAYKEVLEALVKSKGVWSEPMLKEPLYRATDELYYWIRYQWEKAEEAHDLLTRMTPFNSEVTEVRRLSSDLRVNSQALSNLPVLEEILKTGDPLERVDIPEPLKPIDPVGAAVVDPLYPASRAVRFIGPQVDLIKNAVLGGFNCLLMGPTGTGKTTAVEEAILQMETHTLVRIDGHESLEDIDMIGAMMPVPGAGYQWIDGPLTQAVKWAQTAPVVVFIDEFNRIQPEQRNLFIPFLNPTRADVCRSMGLSVSGEGEYYLLRLLAINQVVWCPKEHLTVIAAGNFGEGYQVYKIEPALRRRFHTPIQFEYLAGKPLESRIMREFPDIPSKVVHAMVEIADHVRTMCQTRELRAPIDTGSMLIWAAKVQQARATKLGGLMDQAWLTWADIVCGLDPLGMINLEPFYSIADWAGLKRLLDSSEMTVVPKRKPVAASR